MKTRVLRRSGAIGIALLVLASALVVGLTPAGAAPGDAFANVPSIFVAQGGSTNLQRAVTDGSGNVSFELEGGAVGANYNAIGYHDASGYIYGISQSGRGTAGDANYIRPMALIRIGQGNVVDEVNPAGDLFPSTGTVQSGAVIGDHLYAAQSSTAQLYAFDVTTGLLDSARTQTLSSGLGVSDFTYLDGYLWGVGNSRINGQSFMERIDPATGIITRFELPQLGSLIQFGAAWTYGNGNLGFSHNETGTVYQFEVLDPASATPTFNILATSSGPGSANNDGTSIPGEPTDLMIQKSGPTSAEPGDAVSYTLTVTNNGTGDSSGFVVNDELPAALTNITTPTVGCTVSGQRVTCVSGTLLNGVSRDFVINAQIDAAYNGTIENTATVLANEDDPTPGNNTDTFETDVNGDPALTVLKQADVASLPGNGGTVHYTVTATNTGTGDYATANPAIVIDDLEGVVDDGELVAGSVEASLGASPSVTGDRIVWSGPLARNQSVVIEYDVIYDAAAGGDNELINVAFAAGDVDDPTPTCLPATTTCAVSDIPGADLSVVKTVDPASGTNVAAGDELTYTLTFANNGAAPAAADYTDHLVAVLDDAELTVAPVASDDTVLTVSAVQPGGTFTATGTIPADGEPYTVTYTVTVRDFADQGDHVLGNFLTETGGVPPTDPMDCVPGSDLCTRNFVPRLQVEKTATPVTGVQSGDEVSYTLTFTNAGTGSATVDKVDDLSGVLDDATIVGVPAATRDLVAEVVGDQLEITGLVESGIPATVTYIVQIRPDGEHGDNVLLNFVLDPGTAVPDACAADLVCTSTPVAELLVSKTVDPTSGTTVEANQSVTYTLSFESVGQAAATVDHVDDMTGVLDDADLTGGPVARNALVTTGGPVGGLLDIDGTLAPGTAEVVDYTVVVRPSGQRGDDVLGNWLLAPGQTPPTDGICLPAAQPTCTSNVVSGDVTVVKGVDADGDVRANDLMTYSLTFRNVDTNGGPVDFVDHLDGVLDDADFVAITADGGLTVERSGSKLRITGTLAGGDSTVVKYTVRVRADGARGDSAAVNFVLPNGVGVVDATCDAANPACTSTPIDSAAPAGSLPTTGTIVSAGALMVGLVLAGLGTLLLRGRRQTSS